MKIKAKLKNSKTAFRSIYDPIHLDSEYYKALGEMLIRKSNNKPSKPRFYEPKNDPK
jgi:hypothetical protein